MAEQTLARLLGTPTPEPPRRPESDELTPYDLHGPGRCWHPECRGQDGKDGGDRG